MKIHSNIGRAKLRLCPNLGGAAAPPYLEVMVLVLLAFSLTGCQTCCDQPAEHSLRGVFKNDFLVGVALNQDQFSDKDLRGGPIIKSQFNSISPENVLKWESVHPGPDRYDFAAADRYVEFGEANGMNII